MSDAPQIHVKTYLSPTQKDGLCQAVWMLCYAVLAAKNRPPATKEVAALGAELGLNPTNVSIELSNWRRANGIAPL